ncbi:hypothetical protein BGX27_011474 [Mortierella sp. AM989]|nr:hypothetical protein BGX27_011474 [Mortierella sp. AM989]
MSDESYVLFGTPLPQTTKTDVFGEPKKPNPTRDLEVRDEQGRRRFHGAFTGGFSAGYYNTVGSKEGWAPSEFVSSRGKRSELKTARPEDFMDEEDKQLISDAARLKMTGDFDTLGSSRRELEMKRAAARDMQASGGVLGALPDTLIDDLVVPSSEPVGIRLLKRMGWKPGQGIGPRVSKRQRRPKDGPLSDDDADIPTNVTFAPIDSAIITFTHKSNRQGLGFDPYKNAPEFDKSLQARKESKYLSGQSESKKTGFSFGSFDDDDDDVYGSGPATVRSLDTDLDEDEDSYPRKSKIENSRPLQSETLAPMHCSDGRPPLRGFVLSASPSKPMKWYTAPKVPKDFNPHHIFHEDIKPMHPISRHEQAKLTADDRALVLGETPIDAPRRSVFEYISAENKSRLDNILGFVMDVEGEKRLKKDHWEVPKIEKSAAEAALMGFMPFSDNIAKQNRYKQYLNVQAGISDEKIELVEGYSGENMTKELNEFVQAARIFKPLSSSMANRFTTATNVIKFEQPAAGLRSAEDIKAGKTVPALNVVEKMEVPKSQAAKAAAMGMFGPLTRTVVEFYPSKLLCKRFNVPNPHPEHKDLGPEAAKDLLDKKTMEKMMMDRLPGEGMPADDVIINKSHESSSADMQGVEVNIESEAAKLEEPEEDIQGRPSMDIFKAIFDDSDSDSESDSDSDSKADSKKLASLADQDKSSGSIGPEPAGTNLEPKKVEVGSEEVPSGPFRPIFTKKSERPGAQSSVSTRVQSRSSKLDLSHLNDDSEDNGDVGPKLTLHKSKSKSSSANELSSAAAKRDIDGVSGTAGGVEAISPARARSTSPEDFIGPQIPDMSRMKEQLSPSHDDDSRPSKRIKSSSSTSHRSSSHKESLSSSRHKSSSQRAERDERSHSSSSRSRHRSTSKTRRKSKGNNSDDGGDRDSENNLDGNRSDTSKDGKGRKRRSGHSSTSSRSKDKRRREHRSRSRSKSPSKSHRGDRDREKERNRDKDRGKDRRRERDREYDRERSSKHSTSDKHKSKHHHRDRDRGEESDMEDLWVEKKTEVPDSALSTPQEPSQTQPVNRIRASDFFYK